MKKPYPYTLAFNYIYDTYVTESKSATSSVTILLVNKERVKTHLQSLIENNYWTEEELIRAGKYSRIHNAGPKRRKVPEEMRGEDQVSRSYRCRHNKSMVSHRTVIFKKYKSHLIFKKCYEQSYLKHRFRMQRLKWEKEKLALLNVFEDPVLETHKKEREREQL